MTQIEIIKKDGLLSVGKKSLLKHLDGGSLSRKEAMEAKCFDCMCYFVDGRIDCKLETCPLYDYRPYQDNPKNIQRRTPSVKKAK